MTKFKGMIALDIDGTITVEKHQLENQVQSYLNRLIEEGWCLIFMTGRTFSFAYPLLAGLKGPFFFAPQNGSALYRMPEKECLFKAYITSSFLEHLDHFFHTQGIGLLVESGKENGDICYYKPADFTEEWLKYLEFRAHISLAKWEAVESFEAFPFLEFAVGKFFAPEEKAYELVSRVSQKTLLHGIVIRDVFRPGYFLAHLNAPTASKGQILKLLIERNAKGLPVIAAGDDYNDLEMLNNSIVKIIMRNAPDSLHALADVLAPPAEELGIIQGLEQGIWKALSK